MIRYWPLGKENNDVALFHSFLSKINKIIIERIA
jgi:hypothetical protein